VTHLRQGEQPELSQRTAKKPTRTSLIRSNRIQARTCVDTPETAAAVLGQMSRESRARPRPQAAVGSVRGRL
jgi:hypothetical protein